MEDIKTSPKSLRSLVGEINKGKYNFDLPIQRRAGIWKPKEKSLFIDTLLRNYPLYPALVNKHSDTKEIDVVDFKQRFTTIAAFANDEFKLSKDLKPLTIDATEEEISDIFERINMGHQLTNGQKRSTIQSKEVREIVYSLAAHPFFEKVLSVAQFKKNLDRDIVIQCLMLTEKTDKNNFTSFKSVDMNKFIEYYNDKIADPNEKSFVEKKIDNLRKALDKLNEELPENIKIKISTIPMCVYGMYRMVRDSKSTSKYMEWLNEFLASYDTNLDYLQYCSNATSSAEMVNGRLQFFKDAIKEI